MSLQYHVKTAAKFHFELFFLLILYNELVLQLELKQIIYQFPINIIFIFNNLYSTIVVTWVTSSRTEPKIFNLIQIKHAEAICSG